MQVFIERADIDIKTPLKVTTNIFGGCTILYLNIRMRDSILKEFFAAPLLDL
jgi:hypothetical protein